MLRFVGVLVYALAPSVSIARASKLAKQLRYPDPVLTDAGIKRLEQVVLMNHIDLHTLLSVVGNSSSFQSFTNAIYQKAIYAKMAPPGKGQGTSLLGFIKGGKGVSEFNR